MSGWGRCFGRSASLRSWPGLVEEEGTCPSTAEQPGSVDVCLRGCRPALQASPLHLPATFCRYSELANPFILPPSREEKSELAEEAENAMPAGGAVLETKGRSVLQASP